MSAPSVFAVLCLGQLGGGVVKGITGFGNAIINLLVWVSFAWMGVNGGTLSQAVLCDSLGCVVVGLPLLVATKAHRSADWRLVLTLAVFTTAGAPAGAALLLWLDQRYVELTCGCLLLLVIVLHCKLHTRTAQALRNWRARRRAARYGSLKEAPGADGYDGAADYCPPVLSPHPCALGTSGAADPDASLHSLAVDCLPSPYPSRNASLQDPSVLGFPQFLEAAGRPPLVNGPLTSRSSSGSRPSASPKTGAATGSIIRWPSAGLRLPVPVSGAYAAACGTACRDLSRQSSRGLGGTAPAMPGPEPKSKRPCGDDGKPAPGLAALSTPFSLVAAAGHSCFSADAASPSRSPCVPTTETSLRTKARDAGDGALDEVPLIGPGFPVSTAAVSKAAPSANAASPSTASTTEISSPISTACSPAKEKQYWVRQGDVESQASSQRSVTTAAAYGSSPATGGKGGLHGWLQRQDWGEMRRIVMYGSGAGLAGGVMGGMTGIGGPPIMFMFDRLQVPKETVRGTNAVLNILQVRLITYLVMGVFKIEDLSLYAATSVCALVGLGIGIALNGRINQAGFSRLLVALMATCCGLLFASAFGLRR
ncbi:hypothetical protein HYH03_008507 [Edaphochlamys debaryana]|uniref:Uncharacterized protein n=1 Tax=Edaphochlamys debaryana TaxID=47281 RepID=A0A836BYA5_9CHLO|nr:hypothetical protein HYH03_008507 [Edaphochlamys debaryana]|eukprot:KAG2493375.1 hypothetical protein HYH03_008507 [Edaphochlamys debaryana]